MVLFIESVPTISVVRNLLQIVRMSYTPIA